MAENNLSSTERNQFINYERATFITRRVRGTFVARLSDRPTSIRALERMQGRRWLEEMYAERNVCNV